MTEEGRKKRVYISGQITGLDEIQGFLQTGGRYSPSVWI